MDYIFGRTDDPHGKRYGSQPNLEQSYIEMEQFILSPSKAHFSLWDRFFIPIFA